MTYRELIVDLLDRGEDLDKEILVELARYDGTAIRTGKVKWLGSGDDDEVVLCCGSSYHTEYFAADPVVEHERERKKFKRNAKSFNK